MSFSARSLHFTISKYTCRSQVRINNSFLLVNSFVMSSIRRFENFKEVQTYVVLTWKEAFLEAQQLHVSDIDLLHAEVVQIYRIWLMLKTTAAEFLYSWVQGVITSSLQHFGLSRTSSHCKKGRYDIQMLSLAYCHCRIKQQQYKKTWTRRFTFSAKFSGVKSDESKQFIQGILKFQRV